MEIFSNQAGRVVAIESDFVPLQLDIGDDQEFDAAGDPTEPNSNWPGYDEFNAIITGFQIQNQGGFQFLHTLRDFIYVYTFGERVGQLAVEGVAFNAQCESLADSVDADGNTFLASQPHGLEHVQAYYLDNRIVERPDPIAIVFGVDTAFNAFLTGLRWQVIDSIERPFLGQFTLGFHVIPEAAPGPDDAVDQSRRDFVNQLRAGAGAVAGVP